MCKDPKSLSLTNNTRLAQSVEHQSRKQELPSSILTGGNFLLEFLFCYPLCNLPRPTLQTLCNYEKTQLCSMTSITFTYIKYIYVCIDSNLNVKLKGLMNKCCVLNHKYDLSRFAQFSKMSSHWYIYIINEQTRQVNKLCSKKLKVFSDGIDR